MTDGILGAIKEWTGDDVVGCPWHAFSDPLVRRVLHIKSEIDAGIMTHDRRELSRREIDGVAHFHQAMQRISVRRMEERRKELERQGGR